MKNSNSNVINTLFSTLSVLSLLISGFTLYQLMSLQRSLTAVAPTPSSTPANSSGQSAPSSPANTASPPVASSATATNSSPAESPSNAAPAGVGVQPGQFVNPAWRDIGTIELLKVNRIPGEKNVVNVQYRLRLLRPQDVQYGGTTNFISPNDVTARDPNTSQTYQSYEPKQGTAVDSLEMKLKKQTTADGFTWLQIPEGIDTINIYIPNVQEFLNVPIAPQP